MRDKKYKHIEDLIEDYLQLNEEQIETSLQVTKLKEKQDAFFSGYQDTTIKTTDAQEGFKLFSQLKRLEERRKEVAGEILEAEAAMTEFLQRLNGSRISYEKKDDDKNKLTFLFWIEGGQLKSNRV